MIDWPDGVEESPAGQAREVVQRQVWSSSVWITRDGAASRRFYNAVTGAWRWEDMALQLNAAGERVGYHLAAGWTSVEQCIATAWLHRRLGSAARVRVVDPSTPDADHIAWGEGESDPEAGDFDGEVWLPLRWSCGRAPCDSRYKISSHGRLWSPYTGRATRGFAAHGARWAAARGAGLVNLHAAAGLAKAEVKVPPRVFHAYQAIISGVSPQEHAERHRLTCTKLAWDYMNVALPLVPDSLYGRELVDHDLWRALESLRGDARLGGRLLKLHPVVARLTGRDVSMEELRFARTCVL